MKIKLVRYPYQDYEAGEIVDLGEEKNKSMVSLQRAVWYDEDKLKKPDPIEEVVKDIVEDVKEMMSEDDKKEDEEEPEEEKVLENKTRKAIQKKKSDISGFWDNLK